MVFVKILKWFTLYYGSMARATCNHKYPKDHSALIRNKKSVLVNMTCKSHISFVHIIQDGA